MKKFLLIPILLIIIFFQSCSAQQNIVARTMVVIDSIRLNGEWISVWPSGSGTGGADSAIVTEFGLNKYLVGKIIHIGVDSLKVPTLGALNDSLRNKFWVDTTVTDSNYYQLTRTRYFAGGDVTNANDSLVIRLDTTMLNIICKNGNAFLQTVNGDSLATLIMIGSDANTFSVPGYAVVGPLPIELYISTGTGDDLYKIQVLKMLNNKAYIRYEKLY